MMDIEKMHVKIIQVLIAGMLLIDVGASAQVNYQEEYVNAKSLFRDGKYNLAMAAFEPLIPYDQNNPFSEYASFYYGLAAYKQGFRAVSKDTFERLITVYPSWNHLGDVHYWLATIHFDDKEYFQAMLDLKATDDKHMENDVKVLEKKYIAQIPDQSTLESLYKEYPKDDVIAWRYAEVLSRNALDPENSEILLQLVNKFGFDRSRFLAVVPPTIKKDTYAIAAMLPLLVRTIEPSTQARKNQVVLDFLQGMKMAADTLNKQGLHLSLRAYDTERNPDKIRKLLSTDELKHADLIVGPLFSEEIPPVQEFALANKIGMFNPISNQEDYMGANPYFYLFQPGNETIGKQSALFLDSYLKRKKRCMVFYGETRSDTTRALSFLRAAKETGLRIVSLTQVTKESSSVIIDTLTTATEFDEYNYPTQYTLPKDSVDCIFVASDDPLIYTKVISSVEARGDSITVMGFESWLDKTASDYTKYQKANVIMAAPNYVPFTAHDYLVFRKKYLNTHGQLPSDFATLGYRFMLFAGHVLDRYGVYFENGLHKNLIVPGWMTQGYDYRESQDNHYFSFIRFENGDLVVVRKM